MGDSAAMSKCPRNKMKVSRRMSQMSRQVSQMSRQVSHKKASKIKGLTALGHLGQIYIK